MTKPSPLLLASLLALALFTGACDDPATSPPPPKCQHNDCNEANLAGTCDDTQGRIVCTCVLPYMGPTCRHCAAAYSPQDEVCVADTVTPCEAAPNGGSATVAAPRLRSTLPASWDENWLAAPAVADLDQDGHMEIIAARHSVLYVWNHDGSLRWRAPFPKAASDPADHGSTRIWASPVVGDFNGDGNLEIAVASSPHANHAANIALYDHRGDLMPGWPAAFGDKEIRAITAGDLDGDGKLEILVNKTNTGPATAVFNLDGTLRVGWPQVDNSTCDPPPPAEACWDFGGYNQNVGIADLDGDTFPDVISTYDAIGFGIFHADGRPFPTHPDFTDRVVTAVEAYHDLALAQRGWGTGDRSEFTYSPPVMADITGDGRLELILAGDHEHSQSTANRGVALWVLRPDMTRPDGWLWPKESGPPLHEGVDKGPNIVPTQPNPAVARINSDPHPAILVPAYDGNLYAWSAQGELLWTYPFGSATPYTGAAEPLVADLNGDGYPEIILVTFTSGQPRQADTPAHLIILNNNGAELHKVELFGRGSMAAPTLADLDGDGSLALLISLKDTLGQGLGGVQIWDLPGAQPNCVLWHTGRGNLLRQGVHTLDAR